MKTKNTKRGGARKGAGRPLLDIPDSERKVQVALYLKRWIVDGIKSITDDRSVYISDLVEKDMKRRHQKLRATRNFK